MKAPAPAPKLNAAARRRRRRRRGVTEDSVFWQPGRMGNRRGNAFPDLVNALRQKGS